MFISCNSLTNLDISNFDMKNVQKIKTIFESCYNLRKVKVNNESFNKIKEGVIHPFIQIIAI